MLRPTLTLAVICLIGACAPVEVRESAPEPAPDPTVGELTLANGQRLWLHPDALDHSGSAHYRWPSGKTYDGEWSLGQPYGIGTMTLPTGDRYSGSWRAGQRHGHGELTRAGGSHYVGGFVNDVRQGEGAARSNEGLYRGGWHQDLPHGAGEMFATDGSIYRGQWDAGVRHGVGHYQDIDGSTYQGEWQADKPHGFGQLEGADGSQYNGAWTAGKRDGYGRGRETSGLVYQGTWVAGARQGYGIESRPDGTSYEGEWLAGKRHGQGREATSTGAYHEGSWEQNLPLGPGTRTDSSGIAISGLWNREQVSTGLLLLPTGPEYAGPLFSHKNTQASAALQSWLQEIAQLGDPYAALVLGGIFSDFSNPAPDPDRAQAYFAEAATARIPEAQYRLALIMAQSRPPRAIELLVLAAQAGHPGANAVLGRWYLRGDVVPADPHIAQRYLQRGSDLGALQARNDLAWLLATHEELLDAERALELIAPIAGFLGHWQHLQTLAAAHAAAGDFTLAANTQASAIARLQAGSDSDANADSNLQQQMRQRLEQYRSNETTVESEP